jgi:hypothetical protein
VDGCRFKDHIETTEQSGLTMTGVYGDKAYCRADILDLIKEKGALAYIPVSPSAYKIDEELFSYNCLLHNQFTRNCRMEFPEVAK